MEVFEALPVHKSVSMEELYEKAFPRVASFVSKMGGTFNDAKDVFHDALVIYCEKQEEGVLEINTSEEAYLLGISKHLWIRQFNRHKLEVPLDAGEADIHIPSDYQDVSTSRLLNFLETAGKKCLDLLHALYFGKFSLTQAKNVFGYTSEHVASVQKYKCIEKLRDTLHTKHLTHESFLE